MPQSFVKDYEYGLGLRKPYRFIVDAVERISQCTELHISRHGETHVDTENGIFCLSMEDFENARRALDTAVRNSRNALLSVNNMIVYNQLASKTGMPVEVVGVGRHPLRKLFTKAAQGEDPLSDEERAEALKLLVDNVSALAEEMPTKLAKLHNEVELVTLRRLIDEYESMMTKKDREQKWQRFLRANPFILSLAFGYPIIMVQDQASVGGRKLDGRGGRVTDFLVKNRMTDNVAIVEIKTPHTSLLRNSEYRRGVYGPAADLTGAINQALDQRHQFEQEILVLKGKTGIDVQSYAAHCCLIVGSMPTDENRKKSFELFRRNSKDVTIVTFDELLRKLKDLCSFLEGGGDAPARTAIDDLPF